MKKKGKYLFGALLSLCLVQSTMLPAFATHTIATWPNASYASEHESVTDEIEVEVDIESELLEELPDYDELLAGYFEQQLYDIPSDGISTFGTLGSQKLTKSVSKNIYNILKSKVQMIAEGKLDSTEILIDQNELGIGNQSWTRSELGLENVSLINGGEISPEAKAKVNKELQELLLSEGNQIINYLLADCPYELYWYDKTDKGNSIIRFGADAEVSGDTVKVSKIRVLFMLGVSANYSSSGELATYRVDTMKTSAASTAAENAKAIVSEHAYESDYVKLKAYLKKICELTEYDEEILNASPEPPYGNPWQVIYVFDKNTNTKVVCEGYAKAFQYLCDLTSFKSDKVVCYSVSGKTTSNSESGDHMWNIVTMEDGKNYLVDVTNCDAQAVGNPDHLFLVTTSGSVENGYTFTIGSNTIRYEYDDNTNDMYDNNLLTLSSCEYEPSYTAFEIIELADAVEYGDVFYLETEGGAGGDVAWLSSDERIATVDAEGRVTVHNIGTVEITATEAKSDGYDGASDQYTFTAQKKTLSVADIRIADKKYDGTINASLPADHYVIVNGIVGSDDVKLQVNEVRFADRNVGTNKQVNVTAGLIGTNADRYTIGTLKASADIFPAELTPVMVHSQTKTYDGTVSGTVQEITFNGLKGNDILVMGTDYSTTMAFEDANAGYEKDAVVSIAMKRTTAAGNYQLTENTLNVQGNIAPAPLMIKADNASMEAGAARPNYTVTVNGLVAGETISGIRFADTAGDAKTKGTYTVIPSGGMISSGNGNYEINYSPGVLTITLPTGLISDAVVKAREAKNGVIVSDLAASQISKGTKFVNTSEMDAFDQAIATAETVIVSAVKLDDIQAAVTSLEKQIEVFKDAIKTGTKKSSGGGGGGGGGSSSGGGGGGSSSGSNKKPAQTAAAGVLVDTSSNKSGVWTNDAVGRWFRYSDGTWPAGKWLELSQNGQKHWYYFNTSGYLVTGWILDGGIWYYLNPAADAAQGQMSVGWQLINGVWYYLNPVSGQRPLGAMYCNEWTPDGYFVDASGAWR